MPRTLEASSTSSSPFNKTGPKATGQRWISGIFLIAHGLVHAMGVVLLMKWGETKELGYADTHPNPATGAGYAFALLWLLATVLFVVAGVLLIQRRASWMMIVLPAAVLSIVAIVPMASSAPLGLLIDVAVIIATVVMLGRRSKPNHRLGNA